MKKTKLILPIIASTAVVTLPLVLTSCGKKIEMKETSTEGTWRCNASYTISANKSYTYFLESSKGRTLTYGMLTVSSGDGSGNFATPKHIYVNGSEKQFSEALTGFYSCQIGEPGVGIAEDITVKVQYAEGFNRAVTTITLS